MAIGRPREFDPDEVLETAMELFWERGFDGVSISDLTAATGINRRSLYAAFGCKEELFRQAVQRYLNGPGGFVAAALKQPTALEVAEAMLHGAADSYADPGRPRGCLLVHGALAASEDANDVRDDLAQQRAAGVRALARRFDEAQSAGELPGVDTLTLSRWINALCQGFSVQARSGAGREELHNVADMALAGWPDGCGCRAMAEVAAADGEPIEPVARA
jgi:AcrR family transcriptional regulator